MFFKRIQHKRYDYQPRYYDPEKEDKHKLRKRINFQRGKYTRRKKNSRMLFYILIILGIVYLLFYTGIF